MANRMWNNTRYFFDCKPDCKERKPGCHDHCERYLTKRAQLDEINRQKTLEKEAKSYTYDVINDKRDRYARLRRNYPNAKFHH